MLPAGGPHTWQPSTSRRPDWMESLLPRKRAPNTILSTLADRSAGPYLVFSWANQWSSGESQTPINNRLLGLSGSYHRHAIGMFNTCSWGPTERSLIDTGRGYNLEGAGLPHTHSPTFPTGCLPFPLVAPPGLHFNQTLAKDQGVEFLKNLWPPHGLSTTRPSIVAYIYA
jgi:hypothetical protein